PRRDQSVADDQLRSRRWSEGCHQRIRSPEEWLGAGVRSEWWSRRRGRRRRAGRGARRISGRDETHFRRCRSRVRAQADRGVISCGVPLCDDEAPRLTTLSERTRKMMEPPTQQEFTETVREAFAFLRQFGFEEVSPHPHRAKNPFQVWFRADQ